MGEGDERLLRIPAQSTPLSTSREKWTRWSAASHASEGPTTGGDATDKLSETLSKHWVNRGRNQRRFEGRQRGHASTL